MTNEQLSKGRGNLDIYNLYLNLVVGGVDDNMDTQELISAIGDSLTGADESDDAYLISEGLDATITILANPERFIQN